VRSRRIATITPDEIRSAIWSVLAADDAWRPASFSTGFEVPRTVVCQGQDKSKGVVVARYAADALSCHSGSTTARRVPLLTKCTLRHRNRRALALRQPGITANHGRHAAVRLYNAGPGRMARAGCLDLGSSLHSHAVLDYCDRR